MTFNEELMEYSLPPNFKKKMFLQNGRQIHRSTQGFNSGPSTAELARSPDT